MEVERRGSIFPGTDGGLFAYVAAADGVGQRIEVCARLGVLAGCPEVCNVPVQCAQRAFLQCA